MSGNDGFNKGIYFRRVGKVAPTPTRALRKPAIPARTDAIEKSGADVASPSDTASDTMTTGELLSRAKRSIDSCETSLRAAAEDIARACDQGATQREVAQGVGKSPAWVNRLLKWRSSGYEGTAFGGKFVQGVNKNALPREPASAGAAPAGTACTQPDAALAASISHTNISSLEPADTVLGENESVEPVDRERLVEAVRSIAPDQIGSDDVDPLADAEIGTRAEAISTEHSSGVSGIQRRDLIEALEMLGSARPRIRAKLALVVEMRRASLGLTWDQLIIPANEADANAANPTDEKAAS